MSGRDGRSPGRSGRGNDDRGGRNRGRGYGYNGAKSTTTTGLCAALGTHVFDYGHKAAADQMRTTWEKLAHYCGTISGQNILNELSNKTPVILQEPVYTPAVMACHQAHSKMLKEVHTKLQAARKKERTVLEAEIVAQVRDADMKLAQLESEITKAEYEMTLDLPIKMTDAEKTANRHAWKLYEDETKALTKDRGQAYALIIGQCTQLLQDKMKQDPDWHTVSKSFNPLALYSLIEKTVLTQSETMYAFATIYAQEQVFYAFRQDSSMSNTQWYERFNTKLDVGAAVGVTHQHKGLLDCVAMELHQTSFESLPAAEQQAVREDTEERYASLALLLQSGPQHAKLKESIKDAFTMGRNDYPKTRQQTLHLLDNHSKTTTPKTTPSEASSFAQHSGKGSSGKERGKGGGKKRTFDKQKFKDHKCKKCNGKGHPDWACPTDTDDGKSHTSQSSQALSTKQLEKLVSKSVSQVLTQLQTPPEADSDLSDVSDISASPDGDNLFQVSSDYQFHQVEATFDPPIARLFQQASRPSKFASTPPFDLKTVILLDSQSTMDLFCNRSYVQTVSRSDSGMRLKSNGGTMLVTKKAQSRVQGYPTTVWFDDQAITNILALKNVIKHFHVTYDSNDETFVVH